MQEIEDSIPSKRIADCTKQHTVGSFTKRFNNKPQTEIESNFFTFVDKQTRKSAKPYRKTEPGILTYLIQQITAPICENLVRIALSWSLSSKHYHFFSILKISTCTQIKIETYLFHEINELGWIKDERTERVIHQRSDIFVPVRRQKQFNVFHSRYASVHTHAMVFVQFE